MVIGGSDLFAAALAVADRLEITRVHSCPEGDTFFPAIPPALWLQTACRPGIQGPKDEAAFSFCSYDRIPAPASAVAAAASPPVEPGVGFR
jgi:dihydrofolate reductase